MATININNFAEKRPFIDFSALKQQGLKEVNEAYEEFLPLYGKEPTVTKTLDMFFQRLNDETPARNPAEKTPKKKAAPTAKPKAPKPPKAKAAKKPKAPKSPKPAKPKKAAPAKAAQATPVPHYGADVAVLRRFATLFKPQRPTSLKEITAFLKNIQKKIISKDLRKADPYAELVMHIQKELLRQVKAAQVSLPAAQPLWAKAKGIISKFKIDPYVAAARAFISNEDEPRFEKKLKKLPYSTLAKAKTTTQKLKKKETISLLGVIPADRLKHQQFKVFDMAAYNPVFGRVTLPIIAMISGLPGSGKTTFFMEVGAFLSRQGKKVLFVSNEEGTGATLQQKIMRMDYNPKNFFLSHSIPPSWKDFEVIILDSVNTLGIKPKAFDDLKKAAKDKTISLLGVFKATKAGNYKGESDYEHDVDISLSADAGLVSVKKNRFGGAGTFQVFKNQSS